MGTSGGLTILWIIACPFAGPLHLHELIARALAPYRHERTMQNACIAVALVALLTPIPSRAQARTGPETPQPPANVGHPDESESFDLVLGFSGGGGFDSSAPRRPAGYAGIKFGAGCCARGKHPREHARTITFDLGYERFRSRDGVSGELSAMIPVIRFPNPGTNAAKKFLRVYAEPGLGVRMGAGTFAYYSGKAMIALMSDRKIATFSGSAILEIQRRFPVTSPLHGDTRVTIGIMYPLCRHCGLD
jgi:hypothetical protein